MKRRTMALIALAVVLLDRVTKLLLGDVRFDILPGIIGIYGVRNTGMALGMLSGRTTVLTVIGVILIALLAVPLMRRPMTKGIGTALSLIFGGAVGNLIDRIAYGAVTDFLDLHFFICNVADIAITAGVVLTAGCILLGKDTYGNDKA